MDVRIEDLPCTAKSKWIFFTKGRMEIAACVENRQRRRQAHGRSGREAGLGSCKGCMLLGAEHPSELWGGCQAVRG